LAREAWRHQRVTVPFQAVYPIGCLQGWIAIDRL
jgi:hypothetical protein